MTVFSRPPEDLSEKDWEVVYNNFLRGSEALDEAVRIMKEHIEEGDCTGPWCEPPVYGHFMDHYTADQKAIIFHQAVYRLAMAEAGLNPKDLK